MPCYPQPFGIIRFLAPVVHLVQLPVSGSGQPMYVFQKPKHPPVVASLQLASRGIQPPNMGGSIQLTLLIAADVLIIHEFV